MCRNGRYTERGIKERHGFGSEYFRIESEFLVKIDPALGEAGVLLEPTSVVAKAWDHTERIRQRARSWNPKTLLVTGAGPVGLLAALMGAQRGLEVHVLDHHEHRAKREMVSRLGGVYHVGTLANLGFKPDVLIECSGAPSVVRDVLGYTAASGIACLVGVTEPGHDFEVDVGALNRSMVLDNNTLFGTVNANKLHYEMAGEALRKADRRWLDMMITRREPAEHWTRSLQRQPDDIKVIVEFS
jgi:threonine dehydrogenase-like Zn-dependent dehydrogenase